MRYSRKVQNDLPALLGAYLPVLAKLVEVGKWCLLIVEGFAIFLLLQ